MGGGGEEGEEREWVEKGEETRIIRRIEEMRGDKGETGKRETVRRMRKK